MTVGLAVKEVGASVGLKFCIEPVDVVHMAVVGNA